MMNDLDVAGDASLWKYVDDSTMSETVNKDQPSEMQTYVNEFAAKSRNNGTCSCMHLKESKCKELRISFSTTNVEFEPIIVNNREIEVVPSATLLGLSISNDFKWNTHIENVCKKVSSLLYFLGQLKRAKLPSYDLLLFYVTVKCSMTLFLNICPMTGAEQHFLRVFSSIVSYSI
jgi:hypothetical protein